MKLSQNPLVSIIIPVYNTEEYLEECLDSLVNQTLEDIEIICINDASTDSSPEILERYAGEDERVKIINNKKGTGPSIARNNGLILANGEYIAFVDSDDKIELDAFEKLYEFSINYDHDVVDFNTVRFNYTGAEWESVLHAKSIKGETFTNTNLISNPELVYDTIICNKFVKKAYLDEHGFKFAEDRLYEDILFTMDVFSKTDSIGIFPEVKYYWRVRDNTKRSITQSVDNLKNLQDRIFVTREIMKIFRSQGFEELFDVLYVKLVEIDILQFINELDIGSEEFRQLMISEVKPFVENLPEKSFNTISDFDKLKYRLFLDEDIDTLKIILHQQRIDTTRQKESNIKIVKLKKKVKKLKKQNKKLKKELDSSKSSSGWLKKLRR